MHNLYNLLTRSQAFQHRASNGAFPDSGYKVLYNLEVHVALKQRHPHLAQCLIDIFFGKTSTIAQPFKDIS